MKMPTIIRHTIVSSRTQGAKANKSPFSAPAIGSEEASLGDATRVWIGPTELAHDTRNCSTRSWLRMPTVLVRSKLCS